ncbi:MAG TPA: dihydropteroate synthase [Opitutus sp.]|nr:dihydropteroate synthase [Opitutus sp.]
MASWQSPHDRPLPAIGGRTLVMGVLNVTPDSFSDGGRLPSRQAVVDRAGQLLADGADVLDVGGESTRPGAAAVPAAEEMARVLPAIEALRRAFRDVPLSVDTYKAEVADAAIAAGADIINDIWGALHGLGVKDRARWRDGTGGLEPAPMARIAAARKCPLILMHNRPDRSYGDFWTDVEGDLQASIAAAQAAGVESRQIWLDPGFGFAKGPAQNLEALRDLGRIVALGFPVLVGTSRKSTLGKVLGAEVDDRIEGSGATVVWAIQQGAAMVRVHDVREMARFARMADAIKQGLRFPET